MKWLVLLLVAGNLGLFLWQSQQPAPLVVNAPQPAGASRLILMQELNFSERDSLRVTQDVDPVPEPGPADAQQSDPYNLIKQPEAVSGPEQARLDALAGKCELIRASENNLQDIAERFAALEVRHWIARQITEVPGPMMVYVPPFDTSREAAVEVSVLRSEGIDSFIIPDGEFANGISVGVFGSEANAATRAAQIEALGYRSETYRYVVEEAEAVLNVDASGADLLGDSFWTHLQQDFPSLSREQNSCIEVASQGNFQ